MHTLQLLRCTVPYLITSDVAHAENMTSTQGLSRTGGKAVTTEKRARSRPPTLSNTKVAGVAGKARAEQAIGYGYGSVHAGARIARREFSTVARSTRIVSYWVRSAGAAEGTRATCASQQFHAYMRSDGAEKSVGSCFVPAGLRYNTQIHVVLD